MAAAQQAMTARVTGAGRFSIPRPIAMRPKTTAAQAMPSRMENGLFFSEGNTTDTQRVSTMPANAPSTAVAESAIAAGTTKAPMRNCGNANAAMSRAWPLHNRA